MEKDSVKKMKRQAPIWEKISAKHISDTGLISKVCKELLQLNNKKTTQLKIGKRPEQTVPNEDMQVEDKHMKRCSTSYIIREMQI